MFTFAPNYFTQPLPRRNAVTILSILGSMHYRQENKTVVPATIDKLSSTVEINLNFRDCSWWKESHPDSLTHAQKLGRLLRQCIRRSIRLVVRHPYSSELEPYPISFSSYSIYTTLHDQLNIECQIVFRKKRKYIAQVVKVDDLVKVTLQYLFCSNNWTDYVQRDTFQVECKLEQLSPSNMQDVSKLVEQCKYPRWVATYVLLQEGNYIDALLACVE